MHGLGKKRSKYGAFLDQNRIKQEDVVKLSKLSRETVSKACNENKPPARTITRNALLDALFKLSGKKMSQDDFW